MNNRNLVATARLLTLLAVTQSGAVLAADGCIKTANTNYQIGQTAEIEVTNDMESGTIVRTGKAHGDGNVVARCEGDVTLLGDYVGDRPDVLKLLTVRGQPSGFGIEIYMIEDGGAGKLHEFPHQYQRGFADDGYIRSDDVDVGYRVRRTTGNIQYGRVDQIEIAEQKASAKIG